MNKIYRSISLFLLVNITLIHILHSYKLGDYTKFTKRQCDLSESGCDISFNSNSILIAIDGTGSRKYLSGGPKYKSNIGVNKNHRFIWQSHVANFWEDYNGNQSYYYHGPNANEMVNAGYQIDEIVKSAKSKICNFVRNFLKNHPTDNPSQFLYKKSKENSFGIDIIGYSRGGFAAMDLSRKLQFHGCDNIKPISVRWLGLYDPVQRDMDLSDLTEDYDNTKIAPNVIYKSIAERSEKVGSRRYFGYAVAKDNSKEYKKRFKSSHSGLGGEPGKGDCIEGSYVSDIISWGKLNHIAKNIQASLCSRDYTINMDKEWSMNVEIYMRGNARKANVPVSGLENGPRYFANFIDIIADH